MGILANIAHAAGIIDYHAPDSVGADLAELDPPPPIGIASTISDFTRARVGQITKDLALSIPSVRKAQAVIAGTISGFHFVGIENDSRIPSDDPRVHWLEQPDPIRRRSHTLGRTVQDLIWEDRSIWRVTNRTLMGAIHSAERISPSRIETVPHPRDPELVDTWIIDGSQVGESSLVHFDGAGIGGLKRFGWDLLTLYGDLQAAAGRYARAPHPHAILRNTGADLDDDEIAALLDEWESARETRSIGYLNSVLEYDTQGYSAKDLQLSEAREHAALETARLFGLPARSLDAQSGGSLDYTSVLESRRDLLEALRPWIDVIAGTLSTNDRRGTERGMYVPRGITVHLVNDAYTRDAATERMQVWDRALALEILDLETVKRLEPLARDEA